MSGVALYIENQPDKIRVLMRSLRNMIIDSLPYCEEKITYVIPFFYFKRRMCYLYSSNKKKDLVILGFCQGAKLSNEQNILVGDGTVVRTIEFDLHQPPDMRMVQEVISEAVILQQISY